MISYLPRSAWAAGVESTLCQSHRTKRAGMSPVNAFALETMVERQDHF